MPYLSQSMLRQLEHRSVCEHCGMGFETQCKTEVPAAPENVLMSSNNLKKARFIISCTILLDKTIMNAK